MHELVEQLDDAHDAKKIVDTYRFVVEVRDLASTLGDFLFGIIEHYPILLVLKTEVFKRKEKALREKFDAAVAAVLSQAGEMP